MNGVCLSVGISAHAISDLNRWQVSVSQSVCLSPRHGYSGRNCTTHANISGEHLINYVANLDIIQRKNVH